MGTIPRSDSPTVSCSQIICWYSSGDTTCGAGSFICLEPVCYCIYGEKCNEKRILHIIYKGMYLSQEYVEEYSSGNV